MSASLNAGLRTRVGFPSSDVVGARWEGGNLTVASVSVVPECRPDSFVQLPFVPDAIESLPVGVGHCDTFVTRSWPPESSRASLAMSGPLEPSHAAGVGQFDATVFRFGLFRSS